MITSQLIPPGGATPRSDAGRDGSAPDGTAIDERSYGLAAHPAWPVAVLLVGYPLWWALGLADYMWILLAVPMTARMLAWRAYGNRRLRVPGGFGIWLLFLVCAVAGVAVLTLTAPGTVPSSLSRRVFSYGDRTMTYIGVTIFLLYVGNLTEAELPRRRLAWMLGLVAIYAAVGGIAGMILPNLQFDSPFLLLLPKGVQANSFIQASMHPGLSEVQNVLGTAKGRPKAPFDYTNTWGDCVSLLLPWLVAASWAGGTRRPRRVALAAIALSVPPLLYSLNRGVWIGVGVSILYLAMRFAAQGRVVMMGRLSALVALAAILILVTPVQSLISDRLSHGTSDSIRSSLAALSFEDARASPVIGYGDTRQQRGSPGSIAVGPTATCPDCGQQAAGSTGQIFLLLVCNGWVGTVLYVGFFLYEIWRYRHDRTVYGLAGGLVLVLSLLYLFTYDAVGAPLGITMLSVSLLWKSERYRQEQQPIGAGR